jgi:hypothetical protein
MSGLEFVFLHLLCISYFCRKNYYFCLRILTFVVIILTFVVIIITFVVITKAKAKAKAKENAIVKIRTKAALRASEQLLMGLYEGFRQNDHLDCEITRTTRSRLTINIKSKIKIF